MRRVTGLLTAVALVFGAGFSVPAALAAPAAPPVALTGSTPHRVLVAYVTNRGDYTVTPAQLGAAVDTAIGRWSEIVPSGFSSFTRVGEPVGYATAVLPAAIDGCGLTYGADDTDVAAALAEARAAVGVAPQPGVVDHLVVLVPHACTEGYFVQQARTPFVASFTAGGGSVVVQPLDNAQPGLADTVFAELGHSLGLGDSNRSCAPGTSLAQGSACTPVSHGDCWSPTGRGSTGTTLPTSQLVASGLTQPGEVLTLDQPGDHVVTVVSRDEQSGQRGLAVTDPVTRHTYFVDYRSGAGADASIPVSNPPCPTGVYISTLSNQRTNEIVPRVSSFMSAFDRTTSVWRPGDVALLSPSLQVSVVSVDPEQGAVVSVRLGDLPAFAKVGKAGFVRQPAQDSVAVAAFKGFQPSVGEATYRWWIDGRPVTDRFGFVTGGAVHVPDDAQQIAYEAVVTAPGRHFVVVRASSAVSKNLVRVSRHATLRGRLTVGQRVTATFRRKPSGPGRLKLRTTWYADGHLVAHTVGRSLVLPGRVAGRHLVAVVTISGREVATAVRRSKPSPPVQRRGH